MVEFKYSVVIPVYEKQENFETFYNSIDKILVNHSDESYYDTK